MLSVFPNIRVFSSELALCIRWPKYWSSSFSISPPNEYSELISFRIDWFDLLAAPWKGPSRVFSSTTVESINSLVFSLLYDPTLTSVHIFCTPVFLPGEFHAQRSLVGLRVHAVLKRWIWQRIHNDSSAYMLNKPGDYIQLLSYLFPVLVIEF